MSDYAPGSLRSIAVMRAPTWMERLNDAVRDVYESAAKQPAIRVLDMLGLSDIAGVADDLNRPNTGLRMGIMPEGPGKTLKEIGKGIRAFHASPHDFERFDLSKIGTGEGAQAYGHGLYFAENKGVANGYWQNFEGRNFTDAEKTARAAAEAVGPLDDGSILFKGRMWSPAEWVDAFKSGKLTGHDFSPQARTKMEEALKPRMYEVRIHADPEQFLDWDKPLSQQSEQVQKAMSRYVTPNEYGRATDKRVGSGAGAYHETIAMRERLRQQGRDVVGGPEGATEALKEAGIPGIKYLDQSSRGNGSMLKKFDSEAEAANFAKQQNERGGNAVAQPRPNGWVVVGEPARTRNYVVFDDKLIEIVKKYGIAAALGAGLINEGQARQLQMQGHQ